MSIRNVHSLGDLLHVGREPASAIVLSEDIGPYEEGTTVEDFLTAIQVIVEASHADGLTLAAVLKKTIQNVAAWTWVRRMTTEGQDYAYINDFAHSNGLWVAVGDANELSPFSPDYSAQVFWARDPEGPWARQIGWPEVYCMGVATDGTTWAVVSQGEISTPENPFGDDINGRVWTTSDPTRDHWWVQTHTDGVALDGITYANSQWVAWGENAGGRLLTAGTNPTGTWTSRSVAVTGAPVDITYGNGAWVCISSSTITTASAPTGTWTNVGASPTSGYKVRYANGYWVISGTKLISGVFHGGPWYATSLAGPWTEVSASFRVTVGLVHTGARWVVVGFDSSFNVLVKTTTDPSGTWTDVSGPNFQDIWKALDTDGRVIVIGGIGQDEETAIETALPYSSTALTFDAYVSRLFLVDAVIRKVPVVAIPIDAVLFKSTAGSFTLDSVLSNAVIVSSNFVVDAFIAGGFTVDAVIVSAMDSFQYDAFQEGVFQ